jgi:hypothetical protein
MKQIGKRALIGLMRSYATRSPSQGPLINYVKVVQTGHLRVSAPLEDVLEQSADLLEKTDIRMQKFRLLVEGMQARGMDHLYRHIMREDISEAFK